MEDYTTFLIIKVLPHQIKMHSSGETSSNVIVLTLTGSCSFKTKTLSSSWISESYYTEMSKYCVVTFPVQMEYYDWFQ